MALCALAILLGCRSAPPSEPIAPEPSAPEAVDPAAVFPGSWSCPDSSAVWRLGVADGSMSVTGQDGRDGEAFAVSDVSWDGGSVLRFTARMPSTDWAVANTLRVLDRNRLKVERDGPAPWSCVLGRTSEPQPPVSAPPPSTDAASPTSSSR